MTSKTIKNTPPTSAPHPQLSSITLDGQTATLNLADNQTKLTDPNDPSYWFVIMPMRL